jgi:hypothetical protein
MERSTLYGIIGIWLLLPDLSMIGLLQTEDRATLGSDPSAG